MPQWKKLTALLALLPCLLILFGCSGKKTDMEAVLENGKLRVLMNPEFSPYEYRDVEGNIVGTDVEIAKRIASMLSVELEIVECDYAELTEALVSGKGDLILSAFSATEKNMKEIACSETYLSTAQYIILLSENQEIAEEADLEGKILGVQQYAQGDVYASDVASAKNIERFGNLSEAAQVLVEGKLDAVIADKVTTESLLEAYGGALKKIYIGGNAGEYCVGLRKNSDLLQEVNALLSTMQVSREIDTYVLQYTLAQEVQQPEGSET